MSIHLTQVYEYLDHHPISRFAGDFESLLDYLRDLYITSNPIDGDLLRDGFRRSRGVLDKLPPEDADTLFHALCDLCLEHERASFSHGLLTGLYLMTEINALP